MANDLFNSFMTGPDDKGRFGKFGGRFVSETLMPLILELEEQYERAKTDDTFCLLYTSPSPRDLSTSRMPSSA